MGDAEEKKKKKDNLSPVKTINKRKTRSRSGNAPTAPKRALSAYMYFVQAKRQEIKNANPDLSFGELTKHLAQMWKDLSEEDKAPYAKQAAADKERYAKEKTAFEEALNK